MADEPGHSAEAAADQKSFYDERYRAGYMKDFIGLYEACRVRTIEQVLGELRSAGFAPARMLDYGCGGGRYLDILRTSWPAAEMHGADISDVALELARTRQPDVRLHTMRDERVAMGDGSFDLVLSVEVLEHVGDAARTVAEWGRLLSPGGILVATTPCADRFSLEWWRNRLTGGLQRSLDGYGRFATDEPGHLRRLTSGDFRGLLTDAGFAQAEFSFRAHLFTPLARLMRWARRTRSRPDVQLAMLDWRFFRRIPCGATMLVVAHRGSPRDS